MLGGFGGRRLMDGRLPAEVPQVEIHSKASTSVASVEEVVSPASSKISSAEVVPAVHKVPVSVAFGWIPAEQVLVSVLVLIIGTGGCNGGCGGRSGRTNTGEMNMNVNIDMYTALLGGEGIITLSNGSKIKLKIKPETQNGTKVRVRGKGYDRGDGTFGDLMITYNVKLPTGLNEKQKELLRQMKEAK